MVAELNKIAQVFVKTTQTTPTHVYMNGQTFAIEQMDEIRKSLDEMTFEPMPMLDMPKVDFPKIPTMPFHYKVPKDWGFKNGG